MESYRPPSGMLPGNDCDLQRVGPVVLTCNNTRYTRDGDIIAVCTAVIAPVVVLTICYTRFSASASNVVQPNISTTGAVAVINKLSTVSVYIQ